MGQKRPANKFMLMPLIFKPKENKILGWLKKYWPWLSLTAFLLILFILLAPYIFRPWTKYPEELRANIAWRNFKATFVGDCREECLVKRQSYAANWRSYFKKHPEIADEKYRVVFQEEEKDLQAAIIKIMAADSDDEALPPILADVISSPNSSPENKRLIVTYFPEAFQDEKWLALIRAQVLSKELNLEERVYALRLLSSFPTVENRDLLKRIILSPEPLELLNAAFLVIGAWPLESVKWSRAEVDTLNALIIGAEIGPARWRRLWLLSEIMDIPLEDKRNLLISLANNINLDLISRGLSAEAINKLFNLEIKTPLPSAADWQEYYEKI